MCSTVKSISAALCFLLLRLLWFCFTLIYTLGQMHKYAQVLGKCPDINLLACLALASSISIDQTTRRAENHKEMHHLNEEWLKDYVAGLYWETIAITLCIRWKIWSLLCYVCVHVSVFHWTVNAPSDRVTSCKPLTAVKGLTSDPKNLSSRLTCPERLISSLVPIRKSFSLKKKRSKIFLQEGTLQLWWMSFITCSKYIPN